VVSRRVALAVFVVAVAGLVGLSPAPGMAQEGPLRITLEATDEGYRCTDGCDAVDFADGPWTPLLEVPLGAEVELAFVWAHEAYPNEEHVFVLDGYGLETDQIDSENREAVLHFIADQPGLYRVKCDLHCDLHDYMQRAQVRIGGSGEGTASTAVYTPTTLDLHTPVPVISGREPVALSAVLTDDGGQPITRAPLRFYLETEFGGVHDLVHIGTVPTDDDGAAAYRFRPLTADPEQRVVARFEGMGVYDASEEELTLRMTGAPPPAYDPQTSRFSQVAGPLGTRSMGIVVLAVWATFAFVLFQIWHIARDRPQEPAGTPNGMPKPGARPRRPVQEREQGTVDPVRRKT
jgi:hypothetical protein